MNIIGKFTAYYLEGFYLSMIDDPDDNNNALVRGTKSELIKAAQKLGYKRFFVAKIIDEVFVKSVKQQKNVGSTSRVSTQ